ncbi:MULTISPECIES: hypothetical protein [unclassified Streptomyces]|uniref:hypothetical protein n=1 Tax=unclassified Streptomyces TaxID=2593676 RepID=UPI0013A6E5F8|nr:MULTISPECIES: hypothetical protein [unclassified Streptomyces]
MDTEFPERLGNLPPGASQAARAVFRNLGFPESSKDTDALGEEATVPMTSSQWRAVLADAELAGRWQEMRATALEVASTASTSGRSAGKRLPALARRLRAASNEMVAIWNDVSLFAPPSSVTEERRMARDIAVSSHGMASAVIACLELGWDASHWSAAWECAVETDANVRRLEASQATPVDANEDLYQRTLGLSSAEIQQGEGLAGRARLAAAWSRDPNGLDRRLRQQMGHLIGGSQLLTGKLRQHLAALAVSGQPLTAHRAARLARDLVADKLMEDPQLAYAAISRHVKREPLMLSAYRGQTSAWEGYLRATSDEKQMRPVADLYKVVVEGDVKWTAAVVLDLLGRAIPAAHTLAAVRDSLNAEAHPLCLTLASVIRPEWRNAIAHEDYHWDPMHSTPVLGGRPVSLDELLHTARTARTVCQGFEHGVAVAYAQHAQAGHHDEQEPNEVTRTLEMLQAIGEAGQPVLDVQRQGTCMRLEVPELSIETLRTLFRALLRASLADESIARWEVRQNADRPMLYVDQTGVQAALRLAEDLWEAADPLPFAELPLLANAMVNSGETHEVAARTVLAIAAAHAVGERNRLAAELACGRPGAKHELLCTVRRICHGTEEASRLLGDPAGRKLITFARVLAGECQRLESAAPRSLVHEMAPADRALTRYAPAHVPWIKPSVGV